MPSYAHWFGLYRGAGARGRSQTRGARYAKRSATGCAKPGSTAPTVERLPAVQRHRHIKVRQPDVDLLALRPDDPHQPRAPLRPQPCFRAHLRPELGWRCDLDCQVRRTGDIVGVAGGGNTLRAQERYIGAKYRLDRFVRQGEVEAGLAEVDAAQAARLDVRARRAADLRSQVGVQPAAVWKHSVSAELHHIPAVDAVAEHLERLLIRGEGVERPLVQDMPECSDL